MTRLLRHEWESTNLDPPVVSGHDFSHAANRPKTSGLQTLSFVSGHDFSHAAIGSKTSGLQALRDLKGHDSGNPRSGSRAVAAENTNWL